MPEKAEILDRRGLRRRRQESVNEMRSSLSKYSRSEWPFFLKRFCRSNGDVEESLFSIYASELFHLLLLKVSRSRRNSLIQYLLSKKSYTHPKVCLKSMKW